MSVRVKEFQDEAWVKVVGVPLHAAVLSDKAADDNPPGSRVEPDDNRVYQEFYGDVHAPGGTFGISRGV